MQEILTSSLQGPSVRPRSQDSKIERVRRNKQKKKAKNSIAIHHSEHRVSDLAEKSLNRQSTTRKLNNQTATKNTILGKASGTEVVATESQQGERDIQTQGKGVVPYRPEQVWMVSNKAQWAWGESVGILWASWDKDLRAERISVVITACFSSETTGTRSVEHFMDLNPLLIALCECELSCHTMSCIDVLILQSIKN